MMMYPHSNDDKTRVDIVMTLTDVMLNLSLIIRDAKPMKLIATASHNKPETFSITVKDRTEINSTI